MINLLVCFNLNNILYMSFTKYLIVSHCLDGSQNEDETDIDCGGSCKPCKRMYFDNIYNVFK